MKFFSKYWSLLRSDFQEMQIGFAALILFLLCVGLQFVFSLPHVIALRKLLLLLAFLIAFKYFFRVLMGKTQPLLTAFVVLLVLNVWMLLIAGFISDQALDSFSEWKGQWLPTIMSFVIGVGFAAALMQTKIKKPRAVIFFSFLAPITLFLVLNLMAIVLEWLAAGKFIPSLGGIGDHHGVSNYLTAILVPILFVDLYSRILKCKHLLFFSKKITLTVLAIVLCTLVATTDRNGILAFLITLIAVTALMSAQIRKVYSTKKIITLSVMIVLFMLSISVFVYKIDPRWQNFLGTIPVAWDTEGSLAWLHDDGLNLPTTANGEKVDVSQYYRIAWAREGWRMLAEHPWGVEISRSVFPKLVLEKYGYTTIPHSHNSWIDFGLQVGVPGLILWGIFLILIARFSWRVWRNHDDPLGVVLLVLIILLAIRGLMDSIFRDHEIEQFMLVVGLLFGALLFRDSMHPRKPLLELNK